MVSQLGKISLFHVRTAFPMLSSCRHLSSSCFFLRWASFSSGNHMEKRKSSAHWQPPCQVVTQSRSKDPRAALTEAVQPTPSHRGQLRGTVSPSSSPLLRYNTHTGKHTSKTRSILTKEAKSGNFHLNQRTAHCSPRGARELPPRPFPPQPGAQ